MGWVAVFLALLGSGCAQGVGDSPPSHKEPTTPVEDTKESTAPSDHAAASGPEELECLGGTQVETSGGVVPEGAKGTKVPPLQQTRRGFSEKIREGDRVVGGHSRGTVLVIREGRAVAIMHYRHERSGWFDDGYEACTGF